MLYTTVGLRGMALGEIPMPGEHSALDWRIYHTYKQHLGREPEAGTIVWQRNNILSGVISEAQFVESVKGSPEAKLIQAQTVVPTPPPTTTPLPPTGGTEPAIPNTNTPNNVTDTPNNINNIVGNISNSVNGMVNGVQDFYEENEMPIYIGLGAVVLLGGYFMFAKKKGRR